MNINVISFVTNNFNREIISSTDLSDGIHEILTSFKINKKGYVVEIKAESAYQSLEEEAIRVLKLLPRFSPGTVRGKPVIFPYSLPIVFETQKKRRINYLETKKRLDINRNAFKMSCLREFLINL